MAIAATSFTINVNANGVDKKPTEPSVRSRKPPTTVSAAIKRLSTKNGIAYANLAAASAALGKTYIDLQYSKAENANKAKRFSIGLKSVGYAGAIAGASIRFGIPGAIGAGVAVSADIFSEIMQYNIKLEKMDIRFDYTNRKFRINTSNGSRFKGGSL